MKKIILSLAVIAAVSFTACSDDDGDEASIEECQICNLELLGESITSEYCDNGDGTVTVTTLGESETESLEGISFAQYIALVGTFSSCN